jgi:hypothetical protein
VGRGRINKSNCFQIKEMDCGERIKPMRTGHKQEEMWLTCSSKSPGSRTAVSRRLFMFREAGTQVSVTMSLPSQRATAPPCL